ncbi:hypothetical protein O181_012246 [Austropuccinia psidii MF-1]|uniref:Chromo domain-containing protein n=1 Tax=Austropuccinia psidii MF-1 TaxID=1389203 RepID=A0A9Q3BUB1_9BASI|nr:hypothetical protein [Austropuccinia psidii MF-1]
MKIFIPTYGKITSLDLAQILINHVFTKNGLLASVQLKSSRDISTAFHHEAEGQTEQVNQNLEQYLWMYKVFKEELELAIRRFKKYADRNSTIPPYFQPQDKVWLAYKNINTTRPTKKLSERWLGPFEVLKKVGSHAYHLNLPFKWNSVHPVFHVSLLEPLKKSSIPNQNQFPPPPPILVEENKEWEVAQVLDSKLKRGKLWYLLEWKGFSEDSERKAWEPDSNLTNSPDLVKDFHSFYPDKPGPNTSRVLFYSAWWGLDFLKVSSSPGMHL